MNITALSLSWLARTYMSRLTNDTYSHDHNYISCMRHKSPLHPRWGRVTYDRKTAKSVHSQPPQGATRTQLRPTNETAAGRCWS